MFVPYQVDVPLERLPIANWVLMALTVAISVVAFPAMQDEHAPISLWMLYGPGEWSSDAGLLGSMFTHSNWMHLIGNMMFMFVFGNAVNAKLGHPLFVASYVFLGVVSSYLHAMISDGPGLGASGAISGLMGMFIVFFPRNDVSVFYWWYYRMGSFEISSWIIVGLYFAKDVAYQILESTTGFETGVGLMAHIGGTVAGAALAMGLLLARRVVPTTAETTMLEIIRGEG
ncbi:MAG: rhomboid family intramembrane serine protease [Phycisphaerales bacterium]|jgi:membrane associated rhomboid family serine protease|nr:rhomboid family intramembrane serine protease [Phycisphaerales bacterium]